MAVGCIKFRRIFRDRHGGGCSNEGSDHYPRTGSGAAEGDWHEDYAHHHPGGHGTEPVPFRGLMCGRFFGIFVCIPKVGHTLIFCTRNERNRYNWLCFVLCNSCFPLELESNSRYWSGGASRCKMRYTSGVRRSNRLYLHNGSGEFPPPSNWQRKIPSEHCHRELLEQRKMALLRNLEADF